MHVNVIMGGQLDEHLVFWQPTISIVLCLVIEMEIKYDDDDDDDDDEYDC